VPVLDKFQVNPNIVQFTRIHIFLSIISILVVNMSDFFRKSSFGEEKQVK